MSLTPTQAALDRSTPGFDALVETLHHSADRIRANREFARQVQERRDFAQFQADLQIDTEIEKFQELSPLRREEERRRLEDRAEMEIETAREMGELDLEQQLESLQGPLGEAQLDFLEQQEKIKTDAQLTRRQNEVRLRQQEAALGSETDVFELQDRITDNLRNMYPRMAREHGVQPPQFDDDGQALPVHLNLGGTEVQMEYGEYQQFAQREEQRLRIKQRFQEDLENIDDIARGSVEDENQLGVDELRKAIQDLSKAQDDLIAGNYSDFNETLSRYNNKRAAFLSKDQIEDRRNFSQLFNDFKAGGQFAYSGFNLPLNRLNSDPNKAIQELTNTVKTFGMMKAQASDEEKEVLEKFEAIYYDVQDEINDVSTLVPNPLFNPEKTDNYEDAFLTAPAMAQRIYGYLTSDDSVAEANKQRNLARQEIERLNMEQGNFSGGGTYPDTSRMPWE